MKLQRIGQIYNLGTHQFTLCFNAISGIYQLGTLKPQQQGLDVDVKVLLKCEENGITKYESGDVSVLGEIINKEHITASDFLFGLTEARKDKDTKVFIRLFGTVYTLYYLVKTLK